jgi:hypothetical protein
MSVVRHVHAASSVDGSSFKRYLDERNHLVVTARHASLGTAALAVARSLAVTASYARRDLLAPALDGRPVHPSVVKTRLAALVGFVKLLLSNADDAVRRDRRAPRDSRQPERRA